MKAVKVTALPLPTAPGKSSFGFFTPTTDDLVVFCGYLEQSPHPCVDIWSGGVGGSLILQAVPAGMSPGLLYRKEVTEESLPQEYARLNAALEAGAKKVGITCKTDERLDRFFGHENPPAVPSQAAE